MITMSIIFNLSFLAAMISLQGVSLVGLLAAASVVVVLRRMRLSRYPPCPVSFSRHLFQYQTAVRY